MLLRNPIDRNQKLDSSLATRYLWISWRISGVYPPKKYRTAYYIYAVISNLIAVLLPISTITNIFFIKGLQLMVENLSLTVTVVTATIKHFILYLYQDHLLQTNIYLKKLDKRSNEHPRDRYHVLFAIRICHIFYLVYNILFTVAAYGFAVIGVRTHQLLFNGWYPDFFNDETKNYHAAFIFQFLAITIYVFQNTNNDMYPQCYVAIMIGHLRALIERIERIGKDDRVSDEDNLDELLACIQDHKNILK
ncbi:odorant receptor 2a-like [Teleopsis dalmanni]|uniref:odorant receptor 2a-like n=1 Tax=Teleopsis dalmanni TaxID=139649 RepID=UPI0018CDDB97|nr:odorant receptor 2a-like [Teleopsis dalmanni]